MGTGAGGLDIDSCDDPIEDGHDQQVGPTCSKGFIPGLGRSDPYHCLGDECIGDLDECQGEEDKEQGHRGDMELICMNIYTGQLDRGRHFIEEVVNSMVPTEGQLESDSALYQDVSHSDQLCSSCERLAELSHAYLWCNGVVGTQ